jgi:sec-independent protein translocase protein TatB
MFDIGFGELVVIGVVALLVLGPERLPRVARDVGRWIGRARRYVERMREEIDREVELTELQRLRDEIETKVRAAAESVDEAAGAVRLSLDDVAQPRPEATAVAAVEPKPHETPSSKPANTRARTRKPAATGDGAPTGGVSAPSAPARRRRTPAKLD